MRDQAIDAARLLEDNKVCNLTKRVMLVSPLPERVNGLFVSLSIACFDVFSLHEFNESLLSSLKPELIIYDALPMMNSSHELEQLKRDQALLRNVVNNHIPLLILLDEHAFNEREQLGVTGSEWLVWPAEAEQAIERINRLLESQASLTSLQDVLLYKDLKVDLKRMIVSKEGERIELTKTEYDLLVHFLTSDGSVQTRELLLDIIWGLQFYAGSNVVDVHIKSLRKKLEDSAVDPKYIATVRGVGYRLADQ